MSIGIIVRTSGGKILSYNVAAYLTNITASAMELSLVSALSARLARMQGAVVPTSIPACLTLLQSLELAFQNTLAD